MNGMFELHKGCFWLMILSAILPVNILLSLKNWVEFIAESIKPMPMIRTGPNTVPCIRSNASNNYVTAAAYYLNQSATAVNGYIRQSLEGNWCCKMPGDSRCLFSQKRKLSGIKSLQYNFCSYPDSKVTFLGNFAKSSGSRLQRECLHNRWSVSGICSHTKTYTQNGPLNLQSVNDCS